MILRAILLVLALSLLLPAVLTAQEEFQSTVLQGEMWLPFEPITPGELEARPPDNAKLDSLLEEMRTVFSGMIYGWSFTYKPSDKARQANEVLDVKPVFEIQKGSRRVEVAQTRFDAKTSVLTVLFRYRMADFEAGRRQSWASFNLDQAAGTGYSPVIDRTESRVAALSQALKEAVRNLLRPKVYNKPQEIRGEALLRQVPLYTLDAGRYKCTASFQVRILSVRDYPIE
ncbi:MAG: hypothetical protein WCG80_11405 [Spirochaetales bacterium]